jgi:hypothetical protein
MAGADIERADRIHTAQREQQRVAAVVRSGAAAHSAVAALRHYRDAVSAAQRKEGGDLGCRGRRGQRHGAAGEAPAPIGQPRRHQLGIAGQAAFAKKFASGAEKAVRIAHGRPLPARLGRCKAQLAS